MSLEWWTFHPSEYGTSDISRRKGTRPQTGTVETGDPDVSRPKETVLVGSSQTSDRNKGLRPGIKEVQGGMRM